MLTPVHAVHADLATYTGLWGSAPSLFYTLAMCLIVGACTSTRLSAKIHCYIWIVLALGLELSQHSMVAERISRLLESVLTGHMWSLFGPYWIRGVFDPLDLLATVLGGAIGLVLLSRLSLENTGVGSP
ncbi:hypothetical protein [Neptunomonas sp.]|uniref:hypothetical protein n=1 Tax=Neptunomonas sp. TaxID=1971898 RepID=UPI0035643AF4